MRWLDEFRLWLRSLFRKSRVEGELDEELRFHLERAIAQKIAAGMTAEQARYAALREFGGVAQIQEQCRDTRRVHMVENFWRDLRFGVRNLAKSPLLVITAAVSLGLGIGATTVVYSLFRELVLTPPTARDPHRLVEFRMGTGSHVSYSEYLDLEQSHVLDGLAGYDLGRRVNVRIGEDATAVYPLFVTANFFDVLGVQAAHGRLFAAAEAAPERNPQLVAISHGFWQARLGGDPEVVGRTLLVNGIPHTVLGVLPRDMRSVFGYGIAPEIYLPLSRLLIPNLDQPRSGLLLLLARLKEGMGVGEARAALTVVGQRLEAKYANDRKGFGRVGSVLRLDDPARLTALPVVPVFALLFAVVSVVFLIACANLAGLMLARGAARYRETAIRAALGAGRIRQVQSFLTESLLLAVFGTAVALVLNVALTDVLNRTTLPTPIPILFHMRPDLGLLLAGFALAAATTLVSGLAPALHATKPRLSLALKQDEPRLESGRLTWRKILVAGQVAVSFVLLVTATLFLRNLWRATGMNPGFDVEHVVWAEAFLVPDESTPEAKAVVAKNILAELRSLPGVQAAACARAVPLSHDAMMAFWSGNPVGIEGVNSRLVFERSVNRVSPEYFATMGIKVVQGREFEERDLDDAQTPLIVNQTFVARYLQGRDPIGQIITEEKAQERVTSRIVGVVADSKYGSLGEAPLAAFYNPLAPSQSGLNFLVRAGGPAEAVVGVVEQAIKKHAPLAVVESRTMRQGLAFAFLPSRLGMAVLGSFGLLGLFLAMIGLYGMMAYAVSRRTSEVGIRMALGATQGDVLRATLRDSLAVVAVGMGVGLAISLLATRPLAAFLVPDLSPQDPLSLLETVVLLTVAALAASLLPARRAARIDPMVALRHE